MEKYDLNLFADYYQFYLQDDDIGKGIKGEHWTQQAVDMLLAVSPYGISIGTVRNMTVPVTIELHDKEPSIEKGRWDHINKCSMRIETGKIVVAGCMDDFAKALRIQVSPGCYQVIICYGSLNDISSDGLEGNDHYHLYIFLGVEIEPQIIKNRVNIS
jgi:hypothetical protein